jgi:pilus assembly protein CpaC
VLRKAKRLIAALLLANFVFGLTQSDALKVAQAAIVNQPRPALDFAASKGWAKVLKPSAVITINGNEATFASGGELSFSICNNTAGIQKIEFGTNVTMQPRFDPRSGDIEIRLLAEVADLLPGRGTALPGRATNKLSTVVSLKLGESLILSGIKTSSKRHDIGGLPRLSQIPILGLLFGSHTDQEEEFEGAMSIIPSVVESVPKGSYDRGKAALSQYEDDAGDIDEVSSFPKTPPNHGAARDRRKQWLQTAA